MHIFLPISFHVVHRAHVVGTSVHLHAVRNGSDRQHPWIEGSHACNDALPTHVCGGTIAGEVCRVGHEHHASIHDHPRPVLSLAHGMCCLQLILLGLGVKLYKYESALGSLFCS